VPVAGPAHCRKYPGTIEANLFLFSGRGMSQLNLQQKYCTASEHFPGIHGGSTETNKVQKAMSDQFQWQSAVL